MNEWKEYRFDKFVNVNPKIVFSKKENIPFVEMKDIDASNKFCTNSTYRNLSGGSRFENGDTLFARITPCLENGKIAQVRNLTDGKGLGSTEFHVLRGRPDISLSDFVYYLSRWNEVRDFAEINFAETRKVVKEISIMSRKYVTINEMPMYLIVYNGLYNGQYLYWKQLFCLHKGAFYMLTYAGEAGKKDKYALAGGDMLYSFKPYIAIKR